MKALILCAGKGERLKPSTEKIPKPMVQINKKPLLEYNIELLKFYGIKDIAINTSYLSEQIKNYFGDGSKFGVRLKYSYEPELLGTAGALNNFRNFFRKEDFFVLAGDNLTDINLRKVIDYYKKKKGIAVIAGKIKNKIENFSGFAVIDKNDQAQKFVEKPSEQEIKNFAKSIKFENRSIYLFNNKILNYIPTQGFSDFGHEIFPKLIQNNEKIFCFDMGNYYYKGIENIEIFKNAKQEIERGEKKLNL